LTPRDWEGKRNSRELSQRARCSQQNELREEQRHHHHQQQQQREATRTQHGDPENLEILENYLVHLDLEGLRTFCTATVLMLWQACARLAMTAVATE